MDGLDKHFGDSLDCWYSFDSYTSSLSLTIDLEDNKDYYPGFEFTLKSVFMQPWNFHSNFLFHEKFDDEEDIQICDELNDFKDLVDEDDERASFTQATNVPWTLALQHPNDADSFAFYGKITGPDENCGLSYLNCATPLILNIYWSCEYCGVMKYNVVLNQIRTGNDIKVTADDIAALEEYIEGKMEG